MKRITLVLVAFMLVLSACKKEHLPLEEPEIKVIIKNGDLTQLNLYNNEFDYDILLPENVGFTEVEIKVTSTADPVGIIIKDNLSEGSFTDGRKEYHYLRATGIIQAGAFSDVDREMIKVNSPSDTITIVIGDDLISETIVITCEDAVSITYWNEYVQDIISANVFIHGYNFNGSENLSIKVSSSYDTNPTTISGDWNDPTQYNGPPAFNDYDFEIDFKRNGTTSGNTVGVIDGCDIYIEYKGIIYVSKFNDDKSLALSPLSK